MTARELVKKNDLAIFNRPITTGPEVGARESMDVGFAPYGEYWRQARKICILDLLSVKRVQSFKVVREEEISVFLNKVSNACSLGRPVNVSESLLSLTTNVILRCAFGKTFEEGGKNTLGPMARQFTTLTGGLYVGAFFPGWGWVDAIFGNLRKLERVSEKLYALIDQIMDEHSKKETDQERQSFVDILLSRARSDSDKLDYYFSRANLKAIMLDLLTGGTETSTTAIEWAMSELIKNPKVMKKAQEEIRRMIGKKSKVFEEDVQRMNYLKCVIKETLRVHPPAPALLPRETSTGVHLNGYFIPPKTTIFFNAWAIQRDPKVWNKAEEFIPERFIDSRIDFKGQDFEFIPFGTGRRIFPGMAFATAVVEIALASILYHFDWEMPNKIAGKDLDMTEVLGITTRKKDPLLLVPIIPKDVC